MVAVVSLPLSREPVTVWGPGIDPRAWQGEALPVILQALRDPARSPLLSACTGAGKSIWIRALIVRVLRVRRPGVCVLDVPTQSLVRQMVQTLRAHPELAGRVGVYYGRRKRLVRQGVIVCCRDSLDSLADALEVQAIPVRLYVADEAHLSPDRQAEWVERMEPARRVGVTATPYRSDEAEGLPLWSDVAYRYTMERALAEGVLVPSRAVGWTGDTVSDVDHVIGVLIAKYARPNFPTLCNAMHQDDAKEYAEILREQHGVEAREIHSGQPMALREELLARLVDPADPLSCLVHIDTLTEGVDLPPLRALALRRQSIVSKGNPKRGGSRVRLVQEVGRGLRCSEGKAECLVLDPLGIMRAMGLAHPEALAAVADGEDQGDPSEPSEPRSRAQRERDERESIMVYPVDRLSDWVSQCEWTARSVGLVASSPYGRRSDDPTPGQLRTLARYADAPEGAPYERSGRRRPVRVGKPHSRLLRIAAERVLTGDGDRGMASDLISVFHAAGKAYGAFKAKHGRWPRGTEHWPCRLPDPPAGIDCADRPTTDRPMDDA